MIAVKAIRIGRFEDEPQRMHLDLDRLLTGSVLEKVPVAVYLVPAIALAKQTFRISSDKFIYRGKQHTAKSLDQYFGKRTGCLALHAKYRNPGRLKSSVRALLMREDLPDTGTVYLLGLDPNLFNKVWEIARLEPKSGTSNTASLSDFLVRSPDLRIPPSLCKAYTGTGQRIDGVRRLIMLASQNTHPVLIQGESGTGKEVVAQQIHELGIGLRDKDKGKDKGKFTAINCACLPENLLESELFGHVKGAFTNADFNKGGLWKRADNGTIFLDEIGELAPKLQAKLLRVLDENKFRHVGGENEVKSNARVIAATNRNLTTLIAKGRFREDLYYRLFGIDIHTPALRHHDHDIPDLAQYFWRELYKGKSKCPPQEDLRCPQAASLAGKCARVARFHGHYRFFGRLPHG